MGTRALFFVLLLSLPMGCGAGSALLQSGSAPNSEGLLAAAEQCDFSAFEAYMSPDVRRAHATNRRVEDAFQDNGEAIREAFTRRFGHPPVVDGQGRLAFKGPRDEARHLPLIMTRPTPQAAECRVLRHFAKGQASPQFATSCAADATKDGPITYGVVDGECRLVVNGQSSLWVLSQQLQHLGETSDLVREVVVEHLNAESDGDINAWASGALQALVVRLQAKGSEMRTHMDFIYAMEGLKRGLAEDYSAPDFVFRSQEIQFVIASLKTRLLKRNVDDYPLAFLEPWNVQIRDSSGTLIGGAQTADLVRMLLFTGEFFEGQGMHSEATRRFYLAQRYARELGEEHALLQASADLGLAANASGAGDEPASVLSRLQALRPVFKRLDEATGYDKSRLSLALARARLALVELDDAKRESVRAMKEIEGVITHGDYRARPFLRTALEIEAARGGSALSAKRALYEHLYDGDDPDYEEAFKVGQALARALIAEGKNAEAKQIAEDLTEIFDGIEDVADEDKADLGGAYVRRALGLSVVHSLLGELKVAQRYGKLAFDLTPGRSRSMSRSERLGGSEQLVRLQIAQGAFKAAIATAKTHLERVGGKSGQPKVNSALNPIEVAPALCLLAVAMESGNKKVERGKAKAMRAEALGYLDIVSERLVEEATQLKAGLCKP